MVSGVIDVKTCFTFLLFKKTRFNVFLFSRTFYFLVVNFFYPTKSDKILLNLLNSCIKRLLCDEFNMAELYKNSLLKPLNVVVHIKTVGLILLGHFSFGLINFVNLSTTFFIQRFLTCFYYFHKKRVF